GHEPDLGAGLDRGTVAAQLDLLIAADEGDGLLGSTAAAERESATARRCTSDGSAGSGAADAGAGRRIRPGGARSCARSGRTRTACTRSAGTTTAEAAARTAGAADVHGTDVTLAQHGIPGLLDLAAGVRGDAVVLAVVQKDVGVTHAGRRAVQVVDGQSLPGSTAPVVVVEPGVDVREVHLLRVDVLRALDGVLGGYA